MNKKYIRNGNTFLLDDSKGCFIEVTFDEQVGYLGVNLQGTNERPYCWRTGGSHRVTPDGLTSGNSNGGSIEDNLNALCDELVRIQALAEAQESFKPEAACKALHEYTQKISG